MRRLALAVGVLLLAAACGGGDDEKVEAADEATTTTAETTTTTVPAQTTTTVAAPPGTVVKQTEVKQRKCASGTKQDPQPPPDNWATYWQTQPDTNQPLTLEICVDDVSPKVGQLVTLTVTADDPDASIGDGQCDVAVDWDGDFGSLCRDALVAPQGPEPTPAKEHGHVVRTFTHTYTATGTPKLQVTVWSSKFNGKPHPYDNYSEASLPISVHT